MRCWPTSGPGRSWSRSSASTPGRSCAGCTRRSSPRIPGWICRRRPRRARPGSCRRRWRRSGPAFVGPAGRAGLAAGRLDTGHPWPGRGGLCRRRARAWARPGWPPSSPGRSTTRAAGCCTGAAQRQRPTRCSRSRRRSRASAHPRGSASARCWPVPGGPRPGAGRRCWPAGPTARCCWSWMTSTWPRRRRWRRWLVLRPRPPPGGCWCSAPTATRQPRQSLLRLVERLDPSGAAHRRLGPFDQDEVAQVLGLYESEQAARAAAGTVLERTGGVPLLVHQAAGELGAGTGGPPGGADSQADRHQPQPPARGPGQAGRRRGRPAGAARAQVTRLAAARERRRGAARTGRRRRSAPTRAWPASRPATPSSSSAGSGWSPSWSPTWSGPAWSAWSAPRAAASPPWSGRACCRRWPTACCPAATAGGSCSCAPASTPWPSSPSVGRPPRRRQADGGESHATPTAGTPTTTPCPGGSRPTVLRSDRRDKSALLLVVDQFEEVFTTCRDEAERAAFLHRPGRGRPGGRRAGDRGGGGAGRLLRPLRRRSRSGRAAGRQPRPGRPDGRRASCAARSSCPPAGPGYGWSRALPTP